MTLLNSSRALLYHQCLEAFHIFQDSLSFLSLQSNYLLKAISYIIKAYLNIQINPQLKKRERHTLVIYRYPETLIINQVIHHQAFSQLSISPSLPVQSSSFPCLLWALVSHLIAYADESRLIQKANFLKKTFQL